MKTEITIKRKITAKYKVGQYVFFMSNDFIRKGKITSVIERTYEVNSMEFTEVRYELTYEFRSEQHKFEFTATFKEMFLYESLDEIINHLKDNVI